MSMLSDERLAQIVAGLLRTERNKHELFEALRMVVRETAEACAKVCDEAAREHLDVRGAPLAEVCAAEIRKSMGA